ncbi:MAG: sensor domain-containing diguanylate cyclase [Planctomycetota bacterium]
MAEPVKRVLDILNVARQSFQSKDLFFVFLKGARDLVEQINRESAFEDVMREKEATLFRLMEALSAINAIHDMDKLLPRITELALATVKGGRGVVWLDTDGVLYPHVVQGFENGERSIEPVAVSAARHVFASRTPMLSTTRDMYGELKLQAPGFVLDLRSVMVVPIQSVRGIYGVIYLDCSYFDNVFNRDSVQILTAFANQAAIAIENVRLFESATRDGLTHLYGHTAFREIAKQEFYMSRRYNQQFVVCIMDMDDFKRINDTHGHAAGNRALVEFADLLRSFLRSSDILSRYGGDEFEILLPRTTRAAALALLDRLRDRIGKQVFLKDGGDIRTTASIGLAAFPDDGNELEELFRLADRHLYQAKRAGKNRVQG